jgi:hypothetical protein
MNESACCTEPNLYSWPFRSVFPKADCPQTQSICNSPEISKSFSLSSVIEIGLPKNKIGQSQKPKADLLSVPWDKYLIPFRIA